MIALFIMCDNSTIHNTSNECIIHYVNHANMSCSCLQKVEDTVEMLEVELATLLEAIEAPKWSSLLDNTGTPAVDILEDPEWRS